MLKRFLIAAGLIVFCVAVLAAVKSFGVWAITAVAVLLFIVGMIGNRKPSEPGNRDGGKGRDGEV